MFTKGSIFERLKNIGYFSNIVFVLTHILYLSIFIYAKENIMLIFNFCSITFYLLLFLLIKYEHLILYAVLFIVEIIAHMTTATIICGYSAGFQECLIGLISVVFFCGYFTKKVDKNMHPVISSLLIVGIYISLFIYSRVYNKHAAVFTRRMDSILYVFHIVITFTFTIGFLSILTVYCHKLETKILKDSSTDNLTQIPNRNALYSFFDKIDGSRDQYVLAIFDIDDFKKFNDKNGHICGDYILKEIAKIASDNSEDDFVARWGGEEFIIISRIDGDYQNTCDKIDRIRKSISDYKFKYGKKTLHSTITIGVSIYHDNFSIDDWIKQADIKLYSGKRNGKNQLVQ